MSPLTGLFTAIIALYSTVGITADTPSSVTNSDDKNSAVDSVNAPFFKSRLPLDSTGSPDLSSLSRCSRGINKVKRIIPGSTGALTQAQTAAESEQVLMLADSMPELNNRRTHLKGNVVVKDSQSVLRGNEIVINHATESLKATGGVSVESEEAFFRAKTAVKSQQSGSIQLDDTQFYIFDSHANGRASQVRLVENEPLQLKKLSFTTCPIGDNSWRLQTSEMNYDHETGMVEAWNTTLKVGNVPVFYFPYVDFASRRKSGMLAPDPKIDDRNGFDLAIPVYWNIAPNMDATVTPRLIEKRGFQLGAEYRLLTEKTNSEVNFEWMRKDKILDKQLQEASSQTLLGSDNSERWYGKLINQTRFSPLWTAQIDARKVSDSEYFKDFSSSLESSNETQLNSQMSVDYQDDIWQMNWFALSYQSLIGVENYRYLPSWTTSADYLSENGLRWQLTSEATRFENKNDQVITGERYDLMPSLSYSLRSSWGYLTPKVSYQVSRYHQVSQQNLEESTVTRNLPLYSLDSAMYFDRETEIGGDSYTHSLEPRLFYSYIPYREQSDINIFDTTRAEFTFAQLWRENRFSGLDRVGDTNHVSVALANRLFNNRDGEETLNLTLGRIYYLADQKVQLGNDQLDEKTESPWLVKADYQVYSGLSVSSLVEWDEEQKQTYRGQSSIKFEPIENHNVNLTHRYRSNIDNQQNEEIDFSFAWPVNDKWRVLGRWYNDLRRQKIIGAFAGVEYESCCWAVRIVAQRYLNAQVESVARESLTDDEYNSGIYFQFVFKGLASVGKSSLTSTLESGIPGYDDPFAD